MHRGCLVLDRDRMHLHREGMMQQGMMKQGGIMQQGMQQVMPAQGMQQRGGGRGVRFVGNYYL